MESGIFHMTYQSDMRLRRTYAQQTRLVLLAVFIVAFPFLANRYTLDLANQVGIATIGAIGLNILVGYTGQISLGQGGFMAGAGDHSMGREALESGDRRCRCARRAQSDAVRRGDQYGLQLLLGVWGLAGLTALATVNLFRTHYGRAFIAIRDQDIAASVMGVNLFRYKLLAFAPSSFFVGLAGALTAHYRSIVTWERFTIDGSVLYLAMIIIGGLGSVSGSLIATWV